MDGNVGSEFVRTISLLDGSSPDYVPRFVAALLEAGYRAHASDLHLQPGIDDITVRWRIDGVLQTIGSWPKQLAPNLIARLKILADLLTYRCEMPQEGRIAETPDHVEMRLSTFPTMYGEKAVVRIFGARRSLTLLPELGLPDDITSELGRLLAETAGVLLVTGPAGSGKTTTIYACLREIADHSAGQRSLASLEDPIESSLPGVAQSQINPATGFDLAMGLRSILRQDAEVILVGEIRDRDTAEGVFQASLTGHLVLTTFHAGSAVEAISRLSDMGIEPYLLRSGVLAIVSQRLVRQLCACATPEHDPEQRLALPVNRCWLPKGCNDCLGTGYRGRIPLAEMISPRHDEIARAILSRSDASRLAKLARQAGMISRWERACTAVEAGQTSPAEVRRVLGVGGDRRDGEN